MMESIYTGNVVNMKTTNPLHYSETGTTPVPRSAGEGFQTLLRDALGKVNDAQVQSENLSQKMIYQPESVDVHTAMIAAQKAEISLTLAKAVRDEAIKSYRELMNLR